MNPMTTRRRRAGGAALAALVLTLALGACSASIAADDPGGTVASSGGASASGPAAPTSSADPSGPDGRPHVPGYAYGEFPPIPLFTLPDLAMLDSSLSAFGARMATGLASVPGIQVAPNRCDPAGRVQNDDAGILLYGDGSGRYVGPDGSVVNYGDGSGGYRLDGTDVTVYGDGSGSYRKGPVSIVSYGDGSGSYADATVSIHLYGDGSGTYTRRSEVNTNYGDGSGQWTDGTVTVHNYGDGSGGYSAPGLEIVNYGDGTGLVNGTPVELEKIATVPRLGTFPTMGSIKPVKACAVTVSLPDNVLFDFDQSTLRPEATTVLAEVATVLNAAAPPTAQVQGHTDSIASDDYNQALSERRAAAVVAALQPSLTATTLQPKGFGETEPVAPNTVKGADHPAGRALNRRVDIVIPTARTQ